MTEKEKSFPEEQFVNLIEGDHDILTLMKGSLVAAHLAQESPFIAAIKVMLAFAHERYDQETFKATTARIGARVMLALAEETKMLAEIKQYSEEQTLESSMDSLRQDAAQSSNPVLQAISQIMEGLAGNNDSDSNEDGDKVTEGDCPVCHKIAKMNGGEATKLRDGRPDEGQGGMDRESMLEGLISNLGGTRERVYPNRSASTATLDLEHDADVDNMIQTGNYAGAIARRMILRGQTRPQATQYVNARQTTLALGNQFDRFLGNNG